MDIAEKRVSGAARKQHRSPIAAVAARQPTPTQFNTTAPELKPAKS